MIEVLKAFNLAAAFVLELCALGIIAYWGFNASENTLLRILLGVSAPLSIAVIWGIFLAPKSSRRLKDPALSLAKLVIFGLAAAALVASGQATTAAIFTAAVILNLALALFWRQH